MLQFFLCLALALVTESDDCLCLKCRVALCAEDVLDALGSYFEVALGTRVSVGAFANPVHHAIISFVFVLFVMFCVLCFLFVVRCSL